MQLRPAGRVLEGIVGTVVGAPSDDVPEVAALVVVLREECFRRGYAVSENPPLQPRPLGRGHGGGDVDGGICGAKEGERQEAEDRKQRHPKGQLHSATPRPSGRPTLLSLDTLSLVLEQTADADDPSTSRQCQQRHRCTLLPRRPPRHRRYPGASRGCPPRSPSLATAEAAPEASPSRGDSKAARPLRAGPAAAA